MSYVRWSSDGFRSDVYAYESCYGGFELHIAGRRKAGVDSIPDSPTWAEIMEDPQGSLIKRNAWNEAYERLPWESIEHPDAGKTFAFDTLEELRDALAAYRAEGVVRVPEWLVPMLDEEIAECSGEEGGDA